MSNRAFHRLLSPLTIESLLSQHCMNYQRREELISCVSPGKTRGRHEAYSSSYGVNIRAENCIMRWNVEGGVESGRPPAVRTLAERGGRGSYPGRARTGSCTSCSPRVPLAALLVPRCSQITQTDTGRPPLCCIMAFGRPQMESGNIQKKKEGGNKTGIKRTRVCVCWGMKYVWMCACLIEAVTLGSCAIFN